MEFAKNMHGAPVDYGAACALMDDELREVAHAEFCGTDDRDGFLARYAELHLETFGVPSAPYTGSAW